MSSDAPGPAPVDADRRTWRGDRRKLLRTAGLGAAGVLVAAGLTTDSVARSGGPLAQRAEWAAYASREPFPDCGSHFALESLVGRRFQRMSWFLTWDVSWPKVGGQQAADGGYDLLIAWQPTTGARQPVRFADLVNGRYDDYLTRFFTRARQHPGRVTVRFAHEPNGTGYPWSVDFRGTTGRCVDSADQYVAGWRYVVDFYRRMSGGSGGGNVDFCWCIAPRDRGATAAEQYYPGDDWVDVLGVDVYNGYGGYWATPRSLLAAPYARLESVSRARPALPIWIAELGCREPTKTENSGVGPDPAHSKAIWMQQLFDLTDYPRLALVAFFHAERAHDWRLDSCPDALAVVQGTLARGR